MHGAKYRNAARTCDVIFVNSGSRGREVTELLGVPPEKIVVAYPGVCARGATATADLGRPYVLTVATLEPRKNLDTCSPRRSRKATRWRSSARPGGGRSRSSTVPT